MAASGGHGRQRRRRFGRAVVLVVALAMTASWLLLSRPATSRTDPASALSSPASASPSVGSPPPAVGAAAPDAAAPETAAADAAAPETAAPDNGTPDSDAVAVVTPDAALAAAVRGEQGHLAVAALDVASGVSAAFGTDSFVTASIVKVDILAALLLRTGGVLSAGQRAAATLMIEQSDNDAASTLYGEIGQADGLDAANTAFGLTGTTAGADGYWGLTTTTAADQLRLLQVVFDTGSPLGAGSRQYLQGLMGQIADGQDWGVSAADQGGDPRLKNGWLPRTATGLWVVNSIGRVESGGRELLVAVLSDGSASQQDGIDLVERVATAAAAALTGAAPAGAEPAAATPTGAAPTGADGSSTHQ